LEFEFATYLGKWTISLSVSPHVTSYPDFSAPIKTASVITKERREPGKKLDLRFVCDSEND
jgi:hypothetical protein